LGNQLASLLSNKIL